MLALSQRWGGEVGLMRGRTRRRDFSCSRRRKGDDGGKEGAELGGEAEEEEREERFIKG